MKKIILILAVVLMSGTLAGQSGNTKEQDIRRLLELTGSADLGDQVLNSLISNFKTNLPDVPDEFWTEFRGKYNGDDLVELVIPIYDRHFTHEDIKGLIVFYESPLGQKITSKLPVISQESMAVGQEWGEQIAREAITTLQERGY